MAIRATTSQPAYALGRHYLDNEEIPWGQQVLRSHGMLLDVPRLLTAPVIDGGVSKEEWNHAACTDSFGQLSSQHEAASPTDLRTELHLGWRHEGVYVTMVCWDDDTENLVIKPSRDDDNTGGVWQKDRVGLFWDADRDPAIYVQHAVNPGGSIRTRSANGARCRDTTNGISMANGRPPSTRIVGVSNCTCVSTIKIRDRKWGICGRPHFFLSYRESEFVQWTRTGRSTMRPDQLGRIVFE